MLEHFAALRDMLSSSGLTLDNFEHCRHALESLEDIYKNIKYWAEVSRLQTGQVWRWATVVSIEYVRLIAARAPPALIILAHFAAVTSSMQSRTWFVDRWGEYCLAGIGREMPPEMKHWLEWPAFHATNHMQILGVQAVDTPNSASSR